MKIEILVDASGSMDLNRINKQLSTMKEELKNNDVEVSFLSYGIVLNKKLNELSFPLSDENTSKFGGGGDNYDDHIKNSLTKKLDALVFISDLEVLAVSKETISSSPDTKFIIIEANKDAKKNDSTYMDMFTKNIASLPNVYAVLTDNYTSLDQATKLPVKAHTDMEKGMTLVKLTELMLSVNDKNPKDLGQVAKDIEELLKGYPEDEISQFAQCIAGKRQTLPNSDAVFMLEMNKTNKKKM